MSEIMDLQEKGAVVPAEKQNELRQFTDALLMETGDDLVKRQTMSVPITSLASLGAAVSEMIPALHTVTETITVNTQGLYTLANAGVGDVLKTAKNGNFWGAFKTANGASKFAQLQQAGPINASVVKTLPINPATMMMAVALYSIEKKLDKIEKMQQQIIDFLVTENESQIEADVQMLSGIISKYKLNWDNELYVASNHKMVLDIQRTALKNMRSYQKQVSALLEKKQRFAIQKNVESTFMDLQKKFKYYRMALYTYSLASLLEILLGGNFTEEYSHKIKTEIEQFTDDYRKFFDKASILLEKLGNNAVDTKVLKGIGTAGQAIGKFIGSVPDIRIDPVSEFFQESGGRLVGKAGDTKVLKGLGAAGQAVGKFIGSVPDICRDSVGEFFQESGGRLVVKAGMQEDNAVREFASLGNPGTSIITERMQDMIQIYNHTERICFDRERIYLVGESA